LNHVTEFSPEVTRKLRNYFYQALNDKVFFIIILFFNEFLFFLFSNLLFGYFIYF